MKSLVDRLIDAIIESDVSFGHVLHTILKDELHMTVEEFATLSGVSKSTLYKVISQNREPTLTTLRLILRTVKQIIAEEDNFVALIAARPVLNRIVEHTRIVDGKNIKIREYPAVTIEDAIIAAVRAERDGAIAIVCAPIVSPTIEKIVTIPIATIMPKRSVDNAIKLAARKASSQHGIS